MDEVGFKTRIYTDLQSIKQMQYAKDKTAAKKEVAQQFEALMMQMVLRSMRDASKSLSSGLFDSNQMEFYQEMYDNQMTMMLSNTHLGFTEMIEKSIDQMQGEGPTKAGTPVAAASDVRFPQGPHDQAPVTANIVNAPAHEAMKGYFASPEEFVTKLWSLAK